MLDDVDAAIEAWCPKTLGVAEATFARDVVTAVAPRSTMRAKALLFAAGKLAGFASSCGLALEAEVVLRDEVIERFVATTTLSAVTTRTLRSNLRFLARHVALDRPPLPLALPRDRAKRPYSRFELAHYLALCDAQPTTLRRYRASALVCLGAGAGLIGTELRFVRGHDVVARSGGLLVVVSGSHARAVPVLGPFHARLIAAAAFFADRYLVAGREPKSHNVTNPLLRSLSGGADLARLETSRLRSSYLVASAEAIGLRAFMDAAGITCSQRLGDLVASLEPLSESEAVSLLGARARGVC